MYSTVMYSTVMYSIVMYSTLIYSTVMYNTVMYSYVQYCTLQYCTCIIRVDVTDGRGSKLEGELPVPPGQVITWQCALSKTRDYSSPPNPPFLLLLLFFCSLFFPFSFSSFSSFLSCPSSSTWSKVAHYITF